MMSNVLERVVTVPTEITPVIDPKIAVEAYQRFGYKLAQTTMKRAVARAELFAQLLAMGVRPFDPRTVDLYKRKVAHARWLRWLAWEALIVSVAGLAVVVSEPVHAIVGVGGIIGGLVAAIVATLVIQPINWEWRRVELGDCKVEVPLEVLATALRIRERFPYSTLHVESFQLRPQVVADPFLVVTTGDGGEAYVEVWDEPTFGGRRG